MSTNEQTTNLEQRHAVLEKALDREIAFLRRQYTTIPTTPEEKGKQVLLANVAIETIVRLYADLLPDALRLRVYQLTDLRSKLLCRGVRPTKAEKHVLEQVADYAHESWSHWMRYLFSKSCKQSDGSVVIPAELVARWQRQKETPYHALSEVEKESDRNQARNILPFLMNSQNSVEDNEVHE